MAEYDVTLRFKTHISLKVRGDSENDAIENALKEVHQMTQYSDSTRELRQELYKNRQRDVDESTATLDYHSQAVVYEKMTLEQWAAMYGSNGNHVAPNIERFFNQDDECVGVSVTLDQSLNYQIITTQGILIYREDDGKVFIKSISQSVCEFLFKTFKDQ